LPQTHQEKSVSGDDTPAPMKKAAAAAPIKVSKINSVSGTKPPTTGSIEERDDAAAPAASKKLKKVARAESATTSDAYSESGPPITSSGGGAGYVAVLASIPHSGSSRIDALKRFADMQQQYSTALAGKTPDIASANLGAKGNFDRLVVGPPGSRQEANNVCSQLKAQGYTNCWVTTY
jgi:cell division septation protein DedD